VKSKRFYHDLIEHRSLIHHFFDFSVQAMVAGKDCGRYLVCGTIGACWSEFS
jgi:hypothetical protein